MSRASIRRLIALGAGLLLGCEPTIPDGRLACSADSDCPPSFVCAQSRCYRSAPDAGASRDGGVDGGARDAGTDGGVALDAAMPDGGADASIETDGGPTPVPTQVAAGFNHACARMSDQTVRCWGGNDRGQLGDGTTIPRLTPVVVPGLSDIVIVVAGDAGTCARTSTGEMYCWGASVGDGTAMDRFLPTRVILPGPATYIERGWSHSCAIVAGAVYCWGDHAFLGLQDATEPALTPIMLDMPETALRVAASGPTVVVGSTGVWAWGRNMSGQLGDGTTMDRTMPVAVTGLPTSVVSTPSAGAFHACVSYTDGSLSCWGHNPEGEVGDGTTLTPVTSAVSVSISAVASFDVGYQHTCARRGDGTVWCWGRNDEGEVGDGTRVPRPLPTEVPGLSGVTRVSAGRFFTCVNAGTEVLCWGNNATGQLGDGTLSDSLIPVRVAF